MALGGSVLLALYWAEVRPSLKRFTLSERAKVHILSLDSILATSHHWEGKMLSQGILGPSFDEMCFFSP